MAEADLRILPPAVRGSRKRASLGKYGRHRAITLNADHPDHRLPRPEEREGARITVRGLEGRSSARMGAETSILRDAALRAAPQDEVARTKRPSFAAAPSPPASPKSPSAAPWVRRSFRRSRPSASRSEARSPDRSRRCADRMQDGEVGGRGVRRGLGGERHRGLEPLAVIDQILGHPRAMAFLGA